jgi:hypothetical protein
MTVFDVDIDALTGGPVRLDRYRGSALLVGRFAPGVAPDDPELITAVEKLLPR